MREAEQARSAETRASEKTTIEEMLVETGIIEDVRVIDVTRAAAVSVRPWVGRGDKESADAAAVRTMRRILNNDIRIRGTVVIGEGERDEAPMLYIGEEVGRWRRLTPYELVEKGILDAIPGGIDQYAKLTREQIVDLKILNALRKQHVPEERWMEDDELRELGYAVVDIATDPLEGTTPCALNNDGACCVMALAERGTLLHAPDIYMEKLVVGSHAAGEVSILDPVDLTIKKLQHAYRRSSPHDITIVVMDRPRSGKLIAEIRAAGAKVKLIEDGDMLRGIACAIRGSQLHALMGVGAAPEGVLKAIALDAIGGEIQARLVSRNVNHSNVDEGGNLIGNKGDNAAPDLRSAFRFSPDERERMKRMNLPDLDLILAGKKIFQTRDLCTAKDSVFAATGVTRTELLKGVSAFEGGAITETIKIGASGIVHTIKSTYLKDKKKTPLRMNLG